MRLIKYAFLFGLIFSGAAFAQNLTPPVTDLSVTRLLSELFGPLVSTDGGGKNPLGEIIGQFNAILLVFAGVLLAYTLVAGTMQTAHDGEVLGKKWSSMWLPLRISIGISALVPLSSGYCIAQYIVMWLVLQGVGAADSIWSTFATKVQPMVDLSLTQNYGQANDLASNALRQAMCVTTVNGEIKTAKEKAKADGVEYNGYEYIFIRPEGSAAAGKFDTSDLPVPSLDSSTTAQDNLNDACGTYKLPSPNVSVADDGNQLVQLFGSPDKLNAFSKQVNQAHIKAFSALQVAMNDIANGMYIKKYGDGGYTQEQASSKYTQAVNNYNTTLSAAISSGTASLSGDNEIAQNANRDGWAMAGAFYLKYIKLQQAIADEVGRYPLASPPNQDLDQNFRVQVGGQLKSVDAMLKKSKFGDELGIENQAASDSTHYSGDKNEFAEYIAKTFAKEQLRASKYFFDVSENNNVLLSVSKAGLKLFDTSVHANMVLASLVVVGDSSIFGIKFGVGAGVSALSPFLMALFGALFASTAVIAFMLPLTPYIIWFGVVMGWVVMVIEAIIAAPLWVLSHLHPDADGIVGRGGQGYSLIFALFLRPSLSVIGLLFSMALINPIGYLFIRSYWSVFSMAHGTPSATTPLLYAISLSIFAMVMMSIINKVFALIHVIPDEIFKWMGGPSGNLGSYAGDLSGKSSQVAGAVGGAVGSLAGGAIQSAQQAKQLNAQRKSANEEERGRKENAQARTKEAYKESKESDAAASEKYGGLPEGSGLMNADKAAIQEESKDFDSAYANLASGKSEGSRAFNEAMSSGNEAQALDMVKGEMASAKGVSNYDDHLKSTKDNAYKDWARNQPEGIAQNYDDAQAKVAELKASKSNGGGGGAAADPSGKENPGD